MTQLSARSKHVEELLSKEIGASDHPTLPDWSTDIADIPFTQSEGDLPSDPAALHDISVMVWRLKLGENGETTFIGPSGNFCFSNESIDPEVATAIENDPSDPYATSHSTLTATVGNDSQAQLDDILIGIFSTHINPVHQFVDARTLNCTASTQRPENTLLRLAMMASGALYSDAAEVRAYGRTKAADFEALALRVAREKPCIITAVSLSIMCWRELALSQENMA